MFGIKARNKAIDDYLEERHHESHETKVYKALKKAGRWGLYNHELARLCLDWHRRIGDLRAQGINIQHVRTVDGAHKYYLNLEDK